MEIHQPAKLYNVIADTLCEFCRSWKDLVLWPTEPQHQIFAIGYWLTQLTYIDNEIAFSGEHAS